MSTATTRRRKPAATAAPPATPGGLSEGQAQQLLQNLEQASELLEQQAMLLAAQRQSLEAANADRRRLAAAWLGVGPGAAAADLRKAYRARSRDLHPDAGGDAEGFQLLQLALEILLQEAAANG